MQSEIKIDLIKNEEVPESDEDHYTISKWRGKNKSNLTIPPGHVSHKKVARRHEETPSEVIINLTESDEDEEDLRLKAR